MSDPSQFFGNVCTLSEWKDSTSDPNATVHCLTRLELVGLTLGGVSGFISLASLLLIFVLILRNLRYPLPGKGNRDLIQEPMDIYMLSLFICNLFQALGATLSVKWVDVGKTYLGPACTTQGILQQLGETGVALANLAISIHTFMAVWFNRWVHSLTVPYCVVLFEWVFVILFVAIGEGVHHAQDYEAPSPYWCWLGGNYNREKIAGEYVWLWLALGASILVYVPLHFKLYSTTDEEGHRLRRTFAMLAYPLTYSLLVVPLSIVRFAFFYRSSVHGTSTRGIYSPQATFAVNFIFELSGFFDVMLFLYARPGLLLFSERSFATARGRAPSPSPSAKSEEQIYPMTGVHEVAGYRERSVPLDRRPLETPEWRIPLEEGHRS